MKKSISLIFNIMVIVLMTSCSSAGFSSHKKNMELVGNPSTGYSWTYTTGDDSIIQVEENIQYLGKDEMDGAPSLYMYTISSLRPGNTTLKFEYKRYWEETAADQIKFYEVAVKENGKITMNEKKEIPSETKTFKSVSMAEGLKLMSGDTDYVLLDVRRPDEFASGHIPGAVQLTNETFTDSDAERVICDKSQTVYVYCRSGRRSKLASQKLVDFGYTDVIEIGGILDYSGEMEN